jgi:hypothetical protein
MYEPADLKRRSSVDTEHGMSRLARVAFQAYGETAGWLDDRGEAMPAWDDLGEKTQTCWRAAASAVLSEDKALPRSAVSEPPMMVRPPTPSVGRIVLATVDPCGNNGADVAPAVITGVWTGLLPADAMVNIRVFLDGSEQLWLPEVRLYADRDAADAALAKRREELIASGNGDLASQPGVLRAAYWPPRV